MAKKRESKGIALTGKPPALVVGRIAPATETPSTPRASVNPRAALWRGVPEDTDLVWAVDRDGWTHYGVFSGGRLVARLDLPDAMPDGARTDWLERLWDEAEAYAARRRSLTLLK